MRPHRKLDVWKEAIEFVAQIYEAVRSFPKSEQYALADQLRRAAVSIPSNISEGAARRTNSEFVHFLYVAQGSASEIDTQLEVAARLGYVSQEQKGDLDEKLDRISRMLSGLIRSVKDRGS